MNNKNTVPMKPALLKIEQLRPFEGHPYKVQDNEEMTVLSESIRESGILSPLIVRPAGENEYEVISGHRRLYAARKADLTEVPVLICALDRNATAIALVDSNLHREHILPSEKAFAYRLKAEALKHQGRRTDLTSGQAVPKSEDNRTTAEIGAVANESYKTVQRYIRLTYLIPELLEKMDKEEIAFSVGVELSYLDEYSQRDVLEQCEINDCTPSYSQAWRMHKADREGLLTRDVIQFIMSEEKPNQRETVKIPTEKLRKFAPSADLRQLEDFVLKACEHYRKYLIRQRGREER